MIIEVIISLFVFFKTTTTKTTKHKKNKTPHNLFTRKLFLIYSAVLL